jgi:hypothetical protein
MSAFHGDRGKKASCLSVERRESEHLTTQERRASTCVFSFGVPIRELLKRKGVAHTVSLHTGEIKREVRDQIYMRPSIRSDESVLDR